VLEHRAFPLRPAPDPSATFKGTHREEGWRRCGAMSAPDGMVFTPWPHTDHYPRWSLPALEAAKCVARQGPKAFDSIHLRFYEAFFTRSLDIADPRQVVDLVSEAELDQERFQAEYRAGLGRPEVVADYQAAIEAGVRAIPTVIFPDSGRSVVGLASTADYRAAVEEAARC
jgi:predicted DsbA family dithiol-disulfide isomerase